MSQALAFIAFGSAAALIWLRGRGRPAKDGPEPEPEPVDERAGSVARWSLYLAWALGAVAILGGARRDALVAILIPAGALLVLAGATLSMNFLGAADGFAQWARRRSGRRPWSVSGAPPRLIGAVMIVIGIAWAATGVGSLA